MLRSLIDTRFSVLHVGALAAALMFAPVNVSAATKANGKSQKSKLVKNAKKPSSASRARAVSTDVFELLVGGSWKHKKASGYFRAVALGTGEPGKEHAEVWLQWIAVDGSRAKVIKNISIKEITKLKLTAISLNMDVEETGHVIVIIHHFNEADETSETYEFRATQPGTYKPLEARIASE